MTLTVMVLTAISAFLTVVQGWSVPLAYMTVAGVALGIPQVSRDVALCILGEDPADPADASKRFVAAYSFLPVILATARRVIESGCVPRHEFYKEVLATPAVLSGDDGVSILSRNRMRQDKSGRSCGEYLNES